MDTSRKTINVVAALIRDGKRVFDTARGYGNYKGWWEFPGGKVEHGERPEDALVREIREELDSVKWLPADITLIDEIKKRMA